MNLKYYTMEHRGGLDEALNTRIEISEDEFNNLLSLYEYYGYDERIFCDRYILKDMPSTEHPTWLLKGYR